MANSLRHYRFPYFSILILQIKKITGQSSLGDGYTNESLVVQATHTFSFVQHCSPQMTL